MFDTKYFFNVGLPLWWRDTKELFSLIVGALLFFCVAMPLGFIITKLEERKGKNGNV
jgi:hypothetical protein